MSTLYLNNAFSKQPLPEAAAAMHPFLRDIYENPLTESEGAEHARSILRTARAEVASLLAARPEEIYFVSSGTEANNWALKGVVHASRKESRHIVISAVEHFSVYQTAIHLQKHGLDLTVVPVDGEGRVDPEEVSRSIRPNTVLVSILAASDEIGVIQDLEALAALKRRHPDVFFHTDAVQYLCYESLDVSALPFDLVSVSSNSIYGPAGVAALYIRSGTRIVPLLQGGLQEEGLRPGLQSLALTAGFGVAARLNRTEKAKWKSKVREWQNHTFSVFDRLKVPVTGSRRRRLVDNVHGIVDVDGEAMVTLLQEDSISASTGSTCSQFAQKESHVLKGIGVSREQARGALLFTGSIYIEPVESDQFAVSFEESLQSLRALKPW